LCSAQANLPIENVAGSKVKNSFGKENIDKTKFIKFVNIFPVTITTHLAVNILL